MSGAGYIPPSSGGNVVGPASSTDNAIARFDGATGKLLQNSNPTIDDNGNLTVPSSSGARYVITNGLRIWSGAGMDVADSSGVVKGTFGSVGELMFPILKPKATTSGDCVTIQNGEGRDAFLFNAPSTSPNTTQEVAMQATSEEYVAAGGTKVITKTATLTTLHVPTNQAVGTGTARAAVGGALNFDMVPVGNVGAGPDDLQVYVMPANTLEVTGRGLRISARGSASSAANVKTLQLKFGGTTLITEGIGAGAGGDWEIELFIIRTGSDAQTYYGTYFGDTNAAGAIEYYNVEGTLTEDEDATITIKTIAAAATSDGDVVSSVLLVEAI